MVVDGELGNKFHSLPLVVIFLDHSYSFLRHSTGKRERERLVLCFKERRSIQLLKPHGRIYIIYIYICVIM